MTVGVKDMALISALPPEAPAHGVMGIIERLASDPAFDPGKLEKLIELHERTEANRARAEFVAAFADMQAEIPAIERKGRGDKNTRYAKNEDIQKALRPILQRHGFMLSFCTSFEDGKVTVLGKLGHRSGHVETAAFVSAADTSGSKNAIQALGSSQSYGQRYTTIALLNITGTDESDDDGYATPPRPEPPKDYSELMSDLRSCADEGQKAFGAACKALPKIVLEYALKHDKPKMEALKATAQNADRKAGQ